MNKLHGKESHSWLISLTFSGQRAGFTSLNLEFHKLLTQVKSLMKVVLKYLLGIPFNF